MVSSLGLQLNGVTYSPSELLQFINSEQTRENPAWKNTLFAFLQEWYGTNKTISLTTSGSTGPAKKAETTRSRMVASAQATLDYLKIKPGGKALLLLPATHIGGKMMVVRAIVGGLNLTTAQPSLNLPQHSSQKPFALVAATPTQLMGLIWDPKQFIPKVSLYHSLLVGGAPPSQALEQALSKLPISVYVTYGMTETLSHVALRPITQPYYQALPGITFSQNFNGELIISAPALTKSPIQSGDRVRLINQTTFQWLGRLDNIINSAGVKIQPETIEQAIAPILDRWPGRYLIAGQDHHKLGQCATLFMESQKLEETVKETILRECRELCPPYEYPQKIVTLTPFAETPSGKVDRIKTLLNGRKE
jgi:o-succinylbenzoate---CoA ligase